ncbi:hypothetical protein AOLI_G00259350 [Acnodon oligacanthus]
MCTDTSKAQKRRSTKNAFEHGLGAVQCEEFTSRCYLAHTINRDLADWLSSDWSLRAALQFSSCPAEGEPSSVSSCAISWRILSLNWTNYRPGAPWRLFRRAKGYVILWRCSLPVLSESSDWRRG